jgi:alcohol dehydrogenase
VVLLAALLEQAAGRGQRGRGTARAPAPTIPEKEAPAMMALVYEGPSRRSWQEKPAPKLRRPTDAIVRITHTTLCGTDLHILKGDVPSVVGGRILGHEGTGIVEEVGAAVCGFKLGDRVLISCISSCGRCGRCREGMPSHCENGGGWILGNTIDGTQAEYVRVPFADNSLYEIPTGVSDAAAVMLSDILPTGFECGVLNGAVKPGDSVAIVGAGPIGLAALLCARLFSPERLILIDLDANRLAVAREFGATHVIDSSDGRAVAKVMSLTLERGVDVAIEAVGLSNTFDICQEIVAAGGHLANVGVHGKPVELQLQKLWSHNLTLTTRLVDAVSTSRLLRAVASGKLPAAKLVTHTLPLSQAMHAYDLFGSAAKERALKILLVAQPEAAASLARR